MKRAVLQRKANRKFIGRETEAHRWSVLSKAVGGEQQNYDQKLEILTPKLFVSPTRSH